MSATCRAPTQDGADRGAVDERGRDAEKLRDEDTFKPEVDLAGNPPDSLQTFPPLLLEKEKFRSSEHSGSETPPTAAFTLL